METCSLPGRQSAAFAGPGVEREPGRDLGPVLGAAVHDAETDPRGDFADFVAVTLADERRVGVVEDSARPAVEPAFPRVDVRLDRGHAELAIDHRPFTREVLSLPRGALHDAGQW